ncbi:MAG TPA: aminomethyltransferase family protein [Candidatus Competibacter sp.]|nr:aminomethyltransferase family protein [Candidatus Competibacter sp.]HUM95580.1 aminomethyltransferase family protein [Candidatus Competibacter sp.]
MIAAFYGKDETAGQRDGAIIPASYDTVETEYWRIRKGVALTDYSHYGKFKFEGDGALEFINSISFADALRIPINRMMPSYILKEDGSVFCEAMIGNYGDAYFVLTEGVEPEKILDLLREEIEKRALATRITDQTQTQALIGIDGPYAWELLKSFMGSSIIGTRYLEIIRGEHLDGMLFDLYRAGKTGEYGYVLKVESELALDFWKKLLDLGQDFDLRPAGYQALDLCRMENRFANMHYEAGSANNILELNTRVMVSRDKGDYIGRAAVEEKLENGIERRLIGLVLENDDDGALTPIQSGTGVYCDGDKIGEIANSGFSFSLKRSIALAFLDVDFAYAGLDYRLEDGKGERGARTVSAPFIFNQSLRIRPQEDSYFNAT